MKKNYSTKELKEFEVLINQKLESAKELRSSLESSLSNKNNGTDDTGWTFNMMEDGAATLSKEETATLIHNQSKFITSLEYALVRVKNGTYGVCSKTGELIPKERLIAVPHTTTTLQAKK